MSAPKNPLLFCEDSFFDGEQVHPVTDVTLRDLFAAFAISPMLVQAYGNTPHLLAKHAFEIADAMLAARERQPGAGEGGEQG